jgi:GTP cyclohydrolase II
LVEIDRAVTDLRRGGLVVLRGPDGILVGQAAEVATPDGVARLRAISGTAHLALTRRRAAALHLAPPPESPAGAVLLRVPPETSASALRDLADPGTLSVVPSERLTVADAAPDGTAAAAVELA